MTDELQHKVYRSMRIIWMAAHAAKKLKQPVEICYSGGKDSDVILELAKMCSIKYKAIYKDTSIDPPGTHKHCRDNLVEIRKPKMRFLQIISQFGFPSRWSRFCCSYLKEYKILDVAVQGIRKCESAKRSKTYKEPTQCRIYGNKNNHVEVFYPILDWTDKDVEDFIYERNIKVHPLYYDENGKFDVKRRLGCLGCPLASKRKRIEEFKQYPNMVKLYCTGGKKFLDSHPDAKNNIRFNGNVYSWFVANVFCDSLNEYNNNYSATDCKKFLEEYFNIKF